MKRRPVIAGILVAAIAIDQATKVYAQSVLRPLPPQHWLGDSFRIEYAENPGAFLSLGAALPAQLRFWLFSVAVGLFLGASLVYLFKNNRMGVWHSLSYAFFIGGGLSNLLDRLVRPQGRVVDFMNLGVGSLRTGVFNFADVFILGGVAALLLASTRKERAWPKT